MIDIKRNDHKLTPFFLTRIQKIKSQQVQLRRCHSALAALFQSLSVCFRPNLLSLDEMQGLFP